jgi:hypothetical protein
MNCRYGHNIGSTLTGTRFWEGTDTDKSRYMWMQYEVLPVPKYHVVEQHKRKFHATLSCQCTCANYLQCTGLHVGIPKCRLYTYALQHVNSLFLEQNTVNKSSEIYNVYSRTIPSEIVVLWCHEWSAKAVGLNELVCLSDCYWPLEAYVNTRTVLSPTYSIIKCSSEEQISLSCGPTAQSDPRNKAANYWNPRALKGPERHN